MGRSDSHRQGNPTIRAVVDWRRLPRTVGLLLLAAVACALAGAISWALGNQFSRPQIGGPHGETSYVESAFVLRADSFGGWVILGCFIGLLAGLVAGAICRPPIRLMLAGALIGGVNMWVYNPIRGLINIGYGWRLDAVLSWVIVSGIVGASLLGLSWAIKTGHKQSEDIAAQPPT